jgi:uncharacterized heparinase superfamily protein
MKWRKDALTNFETRKNNTRFCAAANGVTWLYFPKVKARKIIATWLKISPEVLINTGDGKLRKFLSSLYITVVYTEVAFVRHVVGRLHHDRKRMRSGSR